MSAIYFAIPTNAGQAKIANAITLGVPLKITHMAVGDGNGQPVTPNPAQTALVREQRRAPLNTLFQDPLNPAQLVAEQIIPETVGGWWIREVGLFDDSGTLIAIANSPDTYKPQLSEGSGRTQTIRMVLIVSDTSAVELKIDPAVVLATRKYVDDKLADELAKRDNKQSVRVATTGAIALSATQTIDGVALAVGDRVLVKNQASAAQNGIYVVSGGIWSRAADADISAEVTPGLVVGVEQGTLLADTIWKLITDAPIVLNTTALTFVDITAGYAPLASPALTGNPTAPTPAQFDNDTSMATTEFVQRALGNLSGGSAIAVDTTLTAASVGKLFHLAGTGGNYTVTLPTLASVPEGASFSFVCTNTAPGQASVIPAAGETFTRPDGTSATAPQPIALTAGQTLTIVKLGASWFWLNGSKTIGTSGFFNASLSANGYQRLPSGLIIQWAHSILSAAGTSQLFSFPIAFPTACHTIVASHDNATGAAGTLSIFAATVTSTAQYRLQSTNPVGGQAGAFIIAIGY
ncbi:phage tail protein [Aeromonas sp. QDB66]|uniref:phage tail protein n=1 Tax=Aeromonas sp. QDB66 TaxID=2989824 RepID=UPI0022E01377|nr:phage tail protein [Aeromonas sp. QDB66]